MLVLRGIAASPGLAVGEAMIIASEGYRIPRRLAPRAACEEEVGRLDRAIASSADEMTHNREAVARELGDQYGAIFSAHEQMLRDPQLHREVEELIRLKRYTAEYAVSRALRRYVQVLQSLDGGYLAERTHDIYDIEKVLLRHLLGRQREDVFHLTQPVIVLAHNLTPSETAGLDRQFVRGFATEIGGMGGHTSIVASALEIPAVVGAGRLLTDVSGGDKVIIDGHEGVVILRPDKETLARYEQELKRRGAYAVQLQDLWEAPAELADGTRIHIYANIEFPQEVEAARQRGADGVGLYRTEFLYLASIPEPTEEDQFQAYRTVAEAMGSFPVVIRTLDLGADKAPGVGAVEERNPFLGVRSIRLSLRNPQLFRVQLRAILRASAFGAVQIMFPLISTLEELRAARAAVHQVMDELEAEGVAFNRQLPIGMMVETPSAVIMIDRFLKEVDFISIGTNDLIQYTLAVDRSNNEVADLYHPADPAVLRLLEMAVQAAHRSQTPVSVCGQIQGPHYLMLLFGMGIRDVSVAPSAIPEMKRVCSRLRVADCEAAARHALTLDSAREIEAYLKEEIKRTVGEEEWSSGAG
ncbi:MAG: phosphoenolpyruvate--protein phosphotransferase [Planctomycetes bacterium]|nr:phosphoenolpyruvate--protein phosphotransferase [Planctomycetota bacterium]